ncbi:MAG: molybdopterin-dependent oxidoreductase [Brockia lithotrophica]|nr:molybdopterin-dependent oxidoreductase [Brockia lithotrophica]
MALTEKFTRRTFLKLTAGAAAAASLGTLSFRAWQKAQAEEKDDVRVVPTLCDGCSNHCGIYVETKNGRIWRVTGIPEHPKSKGKVCARGQGVIMTPYLRNRVTQPLKRQPDGSFVPISWEDAYREIGERLREILAKYGPRSVGHVSYDYPMYVWYGRRLMYALGSPNVFTHRTSCNPARNVGFKHTVGGVPGADIENSRYMVFIGRNLAEGITPSEVLSLSRARRKGAQIILVDPRVNNTYQMATKWVPIRPGTDLAFVLALAHVLIREELYDVEFVREYGYGFEHFAQEVEGYTPEWAEEITGVPKATILEIARGLGKNRPRAFIHPSWRGAFGSQYQNSADTARAVALVNALLGNYQKEGGLTFFPSPEFGSLDPERHPAPPKPTLARVDAEWPLIGDVVSAIPDKILAGDLKALIVAHGNPVMDYNNPTIAREAYASLELLVAIDPFLSETAEVAHYVLPEVSYLERDEMVEGLSGRKPVVAFRQQVIDKVHPETKPAWEIYNGLAEAAGVGQYFNFTLDELNEAMLAPLGLSLAEVKAKGTVVLNQPSSLGTPKFATPTGKVEFYSTAFADAGFSPIPKWTPPLVMPDPAKGEFRLINGKQAYHSHTNTTRNPYLLSLTESFAGDRLWINRRVAERMGLKEGDWVEVRSEVGKGRARVHLTEAIHPECVFIYAPYGGLAKDNPGKNFAFSFFELVPHRLDPISGSPMVQDFAVTVHKV